MKSAEQTKDLLEQFDKNEVEGKKNSREILNRTIDALMRVEVQEILDRNNAAYQKRMKRHH